MKVLVLLTALLAGACAQVSFSAQLFPGQQTQQFRQGGLRNQLLGLQRQFEAAPPENIRTALRAQQNQLLRNLQNAQQGGQSLQVQLQDALFPGLRPEQFQTPAIQFQQSQEDDQFQGEDEQFQQSQEQQDQLQGTEEPEEQFQQPQEPQDQPEQFQGTQEPEEQIPQRPTSLFRPVVQEAERNVPNVPIVANVANVARGPRGPPCATSAGEAGACVPLVRCITFYTELPALRRQPCRLSEGQMGVCCPPRTRVPAAQGSQDRRNDGVLRAPPPPFVVIPPLSPAQLNGAAAVGLERVRQRLQLAAQLFAQHVVVLPGSAAAWHQEFFQTSNATLDVGGAAQKGVEAAVSLVNEFQLSPAQGTFALPSFSILDTQIADTCPSEGRGCRPSKYRSADGSCNNLANERWGRAGSALQRILPPKYDDGVNAPRWRAANGVRLPSARAVSTLFAGEADRPDERHTLMLMQWGQFLDHDLTHTPIGRGQGGAGLSCCSKGEVIARAQRHPDCFPIELPTNDHVYAPFAERCMEFVRSLPAPRPECNFGPREQMNQITGFLDASNVYGSNDAKQRQLRLGAGGRMQVQRSSDDGVRTLPPGNRGECVDRTQQRACFMAGDSRANEQPQLAVLHTVWLREHNRVADRLAALRPEWDDETLFQEARRVVAAEMQHVTYNEFLPLVLGREYMEKFELSPREAGYTKLYDDQLNGGITNAFATAAFRFGHSLVQGTMKGFSRFGGERESLQLSKNHFSPFVLYKPGALDDLIRGLSTQTCQRFDRFFSKELTERLFQGELPFGLDLVALNVQRGRDHGLPPYVEWLQVCGLDAPTSWNDLLAVMDPQSVATLRELYGSVGEVDLFIGGVAERPIPGALVGHTFVCIIGDQFARLRRGDRFFYEEADQPSSFSPAQLEELRKTSLARVLCDNSDDIAVMQPLAFLQASFANQRVSCSSESIPRVDLRAWQR